MNKLKWNNIFKYTKRKQEMGNRERKIERNKHKTKNKMIDIVLNMSILHGLGING